MRGLMAQILTYLGQKVWPPGPPLPEVNPQAEEQRREANRLEQEVRAELVRAQSDAIRFRAMTTRD